MAKAFKTKVTRQRTISLDAEGVGSALLAYFSQFYPDDKFTITSEQYWEGDCSIIIKGKEEVTEE